MCGSTGRCTQTAVGSRFERGGTDLTHQPPHALGVVLALLLAQQAVRLEVSSCWWAYGSTVATHLVEVELTKLVTP